MNDPRSASAATDDATPATPIPRLLKAPDMEEVVVRHRADFSEPWRMQQAWLAEEQAEFLPGTVGLAWQPDALWVLAILPDREIFSASTADGEHLWMLGDVFEIFVQRVSDPTYLELHVSPNGHQLHLRWTEKGMQAVREKKATLEEFTADPRAFFSKVTRLPENAGWAVLAKIPAAILPDGAPFSPGQELALSLSRYDTDGQGKNAILSSTSPHAVLSYHRLHEWRHIILE
jgi:hypothetical protein